MLLSWRRSGCLCVCESVFPTVLWLNQPQILSTVFPSPSCLLSTSSLASGVRGHPVNRDWSLALSLAWTCFIWKVQSLLFEVLKQRSEDTDALLNIFWSCFTPPVNQPIERFETIQLSGSKRFWLKTKTCLLSTLCHKQKCKNLREIWSGTIVLLYSCNRFKPFWTIGFLVIEPMAHNLGVGCDFPGKIPSGAQLGF